MFIDDDSRPFLPDARQVSSRRAVRFYRLRPVMTLMTFLQLITTHGSVPVGTICAAGLFIAAQSVSSRVIYCLCLPVYVAKATDYCIVVILSEKQGWCIPCQLDRLV